MSTKFYENLLNSFAVKAQQTNKFTINNIILTVIILMHTQSIFGCIPVKMRSWHMTSRGSHNCRHYRCNIFLKALHNPLTLRGLYRHASSITTSIITISIQFIRLLTLYKHKIKLNINYNRNKFSYVRLCEIMVSYDRLG